MLYHQFTAPLGCPHHIGGVDRLIGRKQHKIAHAEFVGNLCGVVCTENIVFNSFVGAVLHQRHMLVCRGVEHACRVKFRKHFPQSRFFAHGANANFNLRCAEILTVQRIFQCVGVVLVNVKNHDFGGRVFGNLPAKLRPDRPAAARDQNDLVSDIFAHIGI